MLLGARDSFEGTESVVERGATLTRRTRLLNTVGGSPFPAASVGSSGDILMDIHRVVGLLTDTGLRHCVVVDLTREDLGIPVVRVLVPGLSGPYGYSSRRPGLRLLASVI